MIVLVHISNNNIALTKWIAEIWECGNIAKKKSNEARNTSSLKIIQVLNKPHLLDLIFVMKLFLVVVAWNVAVELTLVQQQRWHTESVKGVKQFHNVNFFIPLGFAGLILLWQTTCTDCSNIAVFPVIYFGEYNVFKSGRNKKEKLQK